MLCNSARAATGLAAQLAQEAGVDVEDDAQVTRQHPAQHLHRPGFQGLVHQGVVGVAEDALGLGPGEGPLEMMLIHQQSHQFGHANGGVGVVELDRHLLRQQPDVVILLHVAADDVLQRG